jgi:DNA modification methylase
MGGQKAQLVWTDPPYGVNYGEKLEKANPIAHRVRTIENDNLPPDNLEQFLRDALTNASIVTDAGASIYVACPAGTLLPFLIASFNGSGFEYRWQLVWLKDQIVLSRADYHFKHENILYGWKPDGAHYFTPDRKQCSVFEYPRPKASPEHPTMKPVKLIAHMINNSSHVKDIVLDMFIGSGSTLIACEETGRVCYGLELEPKYCDVIIKRWEDFTGKKAELIKG